MVNIYDEKILFYKNVIDNIQCAINKYKLMNILNTNDYNSCIESLEKVINLLNSTSNENIINDLQSSDIFSDNTTQMFSLIGCIFSN